MGEVLPVQRAWRVVLKGAAWKVSWHCPLQKDFVIAQHDVDNKLTPWVMTFSCYAACAEELSLIAGFASRSSARCAVLGLLECKAGCDWDGYPALGQ